ncbi:MAG: ribosome biogenesis GTPase YlqF [Lachnospiraceae bacterium]|nr:ribosome biogenesis GTPase YlqF [Lachnospiraceae bacterium]
MEYQWYPGHMTKAFRQMQEDIKLIDLVIEITDARIPYSARNPEIEKLTANKARMVLLNKADLSDSKVTESWIEYYKNMDIPAVALDSRKNNNMKDVKDALDKACQKKRERDLKRGIKNRPVRALVAGIPNVGKSTFINSFANKSVAKTGNKPGVTKGKQWIRLNKDVELLDTPGVLWPKFEDRTVGLHLAMTGAISDNVIEHEELSMEIIRFLKSDYATYISKRYNIDENEKEADILLNIALSRGCLKKGGEPDILKAADLIIDEFRSGTLGRISVEKPDDRG